jgi:hypothetical protein
MAKGGGHNKGQTMPYAVVRTWDGGKPARTPKWTLSAAEADMLDSLRAANVRGSEIEIRIVDRATGETVAEPKRCVVCRERWATEPGFTRGADSPSLCTECDEDDLPADEPVTVAMSGEVAPLVTALQAKGLEPVVRLNGAVAVTANDIDWTLEPVPHAVTGEFCGVWSAVGPAGSRGQFVALNAVEFVARRTTP